ncbi:MAG: cytochrome c peroxidase, partial [Pseudomonadota bacterium]|nr:cytochrome c peroxidase [Pseudomonadota bacterium]
MNSVFKSSYLWLLGLCLVFAVILYWIDPHGLDAKERQLQTTVLFQYRDYNSQYFAPIPLGHTQDKRKVALGKLLFVDPRLSGDNSTACVSCHSFALGGTDARRVSIGVEGRMGSLNAPTVFNTAFNISQFWDGRAETLEQQVSGPIHQPHEMNSNWAEVIAKLSVDHSLRKQFKAIYPDGIAEENIVDALVSFERALITPGSSFDRYLNGDTAALDSRAEEGMRRFIEFGCVSCHQGVNLGGNMYQRFGVFEEFDKDIVMSNHWQGRYAVTGRE